MTAAAPSRATAGTASPWLPFPPPGGRLRLYCLPHAGGSASAFRPWFGRLAGVSVRPVQPPGRETRLRETPYVRMTEFVDDLSDALLDELATDQGPYAVYGHSLGAWVAFELVRAIRRRGGPDPAHLVVSGAAAPDHPAYDDGPPVGGMTDAQVVALLRRIGGTPEWMLADPSVLRMILPPFRADFAVKESYRYLPEQALDVPITALAATGDLRAGIGSMDGWRRQTTRAFRSRTLVGGHFAVLEQADLTLRYLGEALRSAVPAELDAA